MRRLLIAGNWKMHLTRAQSAELAGAVAKHVGTGGAVDAAVCPPTVYLAAVVAAAKGSAVAVGAQNCYHEPQGAFRYDCPNDGGCHESHDDPERDIHR